jgi:hypothetical protein
VKQEIFSRNYDIDGVPQPIQSVEEYVVPEETYSQKVTEPESALEEIVTTAPASPRKSRRWTFREEKDLVAYYQAGMTIDQLARLFGKDEDIVIEKLVQKGFTI